MRDRRLAFLLGEDQLNKEDVNQKNNHETSRFTKASCVPPAGVNKKIQNKLKTNSKQTLTSVSSNNSPLKEVLNRELTSSSCSMYDSAEIVANALGKSKRYGKESPSFKSSSVSNLRKNSPKARTFHEGNTGTNHSVRTNGANRADHTIDSNKK